MKKLLILLFLIPVIVLGQEEKIISANDITEIDGVFYFKLKKIALSAQANWWQKWTLSHYLMYRSKCNPRHGRDGRPQHRHSSWEGRGRSGRDQAFASEGLREGVPAVDGAAGETQKPLPRAGVPGAR